MASCKGFPAAWAMAIGNCSMISFVSVAVGPFVMLLLIIVLLLLIVAVALLLLLLIDGVDVVVQLLSEVFGDVGVELLFVMFSELLLILLLVEFKWLLLPLQVLLLPESWNEVFANGGDEAAVCDASDDVEVVRSLTNVPSGRTNICFVPTICGNKRSGKREISTVKKLRIYIYIKDYKS